MNSLLLLILQIGIIIIASRLVGLLLRRLQQPQVMGEMVAGIMLGPSLLGYLAPEIARALFPPESLVYLSALSQMGLLLFMFLVGLEFDPKLLSGKSHTAVLTSHTSITMPFLLGVMVALYLYPKHSDDSVSFTGFALFLGAAMSVTAFPVLARILTERNLLRTKVGAITIACAAIDDITAWSILAGVIALVRATGMRELLFTLVGSALYVVLMVFAVRPLLGKLEAYYQQREKLTQNMVAIILLYLLASAWTTEWLGIHALFGAFLAGAIMPKDRGIVHTLTEKLEDVTILLLLPLFFAYTGLRTRIGLISDTTLVFDCLLIIAVAVAGKFGGSMAAARVTGLNWREAGAVGTLMNTRGLMELVILTIGYDLGVISPTIFVMMVLMALVTTFMTTPLLELIYPIRLIRKEIIGFEEEEKKYTVLIPVSLPSSGPELLRMATALAPPAKSRVYALHLTRASEQSVISTGTFSLVNERESLQPLLEAALAMEQDLDIHLMSFVSRNIGKDIIDVANIKGSHLILLGWHKPLFTDYLVGSTVQAVMKDAKTDVAVYLARQFDPWRRVLVPFIGSRHDEAALELARRFLNQFADVEITVLKVDQEASENPPLPSQRLGLENSMLTPRLNLKSVVSEDPQEAILQEAHRDYDLIIIGAYDSGGEEQKLFGRWHERLATECAASLLVIRKYVASPIMERSLTTETQRSK